MNFYELFEISQLKAINLALEPTLESIWRLKCRQYSVTYSTPLHVVMHELDPMMVLEALYEEQYPPSMIEDELEEILDKLYVIKDPTYSRMTKEETEELVDAVLNKEIKRMGNKKRPTEQKTTSEKVKPSKPKKGSMSFEDLEKIDENGEANRGGFKD